MGVGEGYSIVNVKATMELGSYCIICKVKATTSDNSQYNDAVKFMYQILYGINDIWFTKQTKNQILSYDNTDERDKSLRKESNLLTQV